MIIYGDTCVFAAVSGTGVRGRESCTWGALINNLVHRNDSVGSNAVHVQTANCVIAVLIEYVSSPPEALQRRRYREYIAGGVDISIMLDSWITEKFGA